MQPVPMRRRRLLQAAAAATTLLSPLARAQAGWPSRPIRILVPFAAGISPDIVARMVGEPLSRALGQPVLVENRAGASGIIGAEAAARSGGDGYTVFMTVESLVGVMPHVYSKLPYDPFRDFAPVTQVVSVPYFLLTGPQQPFQSVRDVIAQARAKPGGMDYGTLGVGSAAHVRMAMLNRMAGTAMTHVAYKGSYMPDLMSGVLTVAFEPATTAIPLIRGGKLRALAVATSQRLPAFPDVATVAETLPGFNGDGWQAFVVPAGTPTDIAHRLNTETVRILQQPDIRARLADFGLQAMGNSREEFARAMRSEYEKWGRIARENNIRVEG